MTIRTQFKDGIFVPLEKVKELKAKGVPFIHESPGQNQWGRYMAFKDPSGIVHELMESSP